MELARPFLAESLPPMAVPKWTIQCYLKWVWPRVTFLLIFLKPAIRLSSALTALVQSCTQNMSRESTPMECSAWAGVPGPFPRLAPVPFSPQNLEGHPHTHHCRCGLLEAPCVPHRCTSREPTSQRSTRDGCTRCPPPPLPARVWPGLRLREASGS